MKKIVFLVLFSVLLLSACSNDNENIDKMKNSSVENSKIKDNDSKEINNLDTEKFSLSLEDIDGNKYEINNETNKKVYIKFWASWCPICLDGLDEINRASVENNDYEIVTVVSPGHIGEKNRDEFITWFNSLEYKNIKVLLDEKGELVKKYNIRSTPTNFIIDSNSELVKIIPGQLEKGLIDKIFAEVD